MLTDEEREQLDNEISNILDKLSALNKRIEDVNADSENSRKYIAEIAAQLELLVSKDYDTEDSYSELVKSIGNNITKLEKKIEFIPAIQENIKNIKESIHDIENDVKKCFSLYESLNTSAHSHDDKIYFYEKTLGECGLRCESYRKAIGVQIDKNGSIINSNSKEINKLSIAGEEFRPFIEDIKNLKNKFENISKYFWLVTVVLPSITIFISLLLTIILNWQKLLKFF